MNNRIKQLIEDYLAFNPAEIKGKKDKYDRLRDDIRDGQIEDLKKMKYNKTEYPEDMSKYPVSMAYDYASIGEIVCEYLSENNSDFYEYCFKVYFKDGPEMQLYDHVNIYLNVGFESTPVANVYLDEDDPYDITMFLQCSIWSSNGGNRPIMIRHGDKQYSSHYPITSDYTDFLRYLHDRGYRIDEYRIIDQNKTPVYCFKHQLCNKEIKEAMVDNLPMITISDAASFDYSEEDNITQLFTVNVSPNFTYVFDKDVIFENVQTVEKFIDKICSQGIKRIQIDYEPIIENQEEQDVPWGYTLCSYTIAKQCQKHKIPLAMETYKRKQIVTLQGNQCLLDKGIIDLETLRGKGEYEMRFYSYVDKIQAQAKSKGGNKYYLFRYHAEWGPTNDKHWAEIIFRQYYSSICEIERIEYLDQVYRDGKTIDLAAEK